MASSPRAPDDGFATPAAVLISLAIASIAIAVQARAIAMLHQSQDDYARAGSEMMLQGAQVLAARRLVSDRATETGGWRESLSGRTAQVLAEPEAAKLNLADAAKLDGSMLRALGAQRPSQVQIALAALAVEPELTPDRLVALDSAPRWRRCAPGLISQFGQETGGLTGHGLHAHTGEVWRIQTRDAAGWTDDRIVRITGDGDNPVRTIARSFYRLSAGAPPCPILAAAAPPGRTDIP